MNPEHNHSAVIISVVLHILLLVALYAFRDSQVTLIPARSDGISLSFMEITAPIPSNATQQTPISNNPQTLDRNADINFQEKNLKTSPPRIENLPPKKPSKVVAENLTKPKDSIKKKAQTTDTQLNDLLGELDSQQQTTLNNGNALGGIAEGTSNSNILKANYADLIVRRVRPFVIIPEDIDSTQNAVVEVELNPDLTIRSVTLIKSSGNEIYDENVQQALIRVNTFPELPAGANFVDYRLIKINFRPN